MYADADGQEYLPLPGHADPRVRGHGGRPAHGATERALGRAIPLAVYTGDMFDTGHDADNRAAVATVPGRELDLVGVAMRAPRNAVDKVLKGTRLHP